MSNCMSRHLPALLHLSVAPQGDGMILFKWQDDIIGVAQFSDACLERAYTSASPPVRDQASVKPCIGWKRCKVSSFFLWQLAPWSPAARSMEALPLCGFCATCHAHGNIRRMARILVAWLVLEWAAGSIIPCNHAWKLQKCAKGSICCRGPSHGKAGGEQMGADP